VKKRTKAEIDPSILETALSVLAVGASRQVAAAQAGISKVTLWSYENRGREAWEKREAGIEAGVEVELSESEAFFAEFYARVRKAESTTQAYMLGLIQKAANGDWRAGAWVLEKLYPAEFGKRLEVHAEHSGTVSASVDLSKLSEDELFELRKLRRKISPDAED